MDIWITSDFWNGKLMATMATPGATWATLATLATLAPTLLWRNMSPTKGPQSAPILLFLGLSSWRAVTGPVKAEGCELKQLIYNWYTIGSCSTLLECFPPINPNQIKRIGRWFNQLRNAPKHAPHSIHHPCLTFEEQAWQEHATILRHPHNFFLDG